MVVTVQSSIPGEPSACYAQSMTSELTYGWSTLGFMGLSRRYILKEPIYECVSIRQNLSIRRTEYLLV